MELTIEQLLQQGTAAHKEGNLQEAERLYSTILQSQPHHPDANHNLGVLAVSVDKSEAALPLFKAALEANPKIEQFWLSYIDALIKEKQFVAAKQVVEQAKKQEVNIGSLHSLELQLKRTTPLDELKSTSQKKDLRFKEKLKKSAKNTKVEKQDLKGINPSDVEINNLLQHYKNGQQDDAEKLALSITERFPKHPFAWKVLGALLKQTGRTVESLAPMRKSVQLAPQDAQAHTNLGLTLKELGKLEEAEASHAHAIALEPNFSKAHYNLGSTLKELGRLQDAEASYTRAIALEPNFADAHGNLGNILQKLGRLQDSEACYTRVIALNPKSAEAHGNLGNTLKELGRLQDAEASYIRATALKPNFIEAHFNLGITQKELGRVEDAEASYTRAIALKPNFAEAHNSLGIMLHELNRLKEAEASYTEAIALKPDYDGAYTNLGNTLQELGQLEKAEKIYTQAIALNPDSALAHTNIGTLFKEMGRQEEAEASYKKALKLAPDYDIARYNMGLHLYENKHYSLAADLFELNDVYLSKTYAIQCSYHQDEESIFFEKLDSLIKQGELNAVIGSLTSCSAIKYGIKRSNPFCNDPLKYLSKIDLNLQYNFEEIFVKTALEVLTDKSVSHKDQGLLTNGIQTSGNVFEIKKFAGTKIESIILTEIEKYRINFKDSKEGFIMNWPASYNIRGWLISMKSGGKLAPHIHERGWISGSVYINVPPKSTVDSGNLVINLTKEEQVLGAKNSSISIDVVTGSLCLFPASLYHYTVPFEEEENRIVLAFDVIPTKQCIDYQ